MKVTYYNYFLRDSKKRYHFNLDQLLNKFSEIKSSEFLSTFRYSDNRLYLFKVTSFVYLFIMTRNEELVKAINSKQMSHEDICNRLDGDENLGFSSYIYVDRFFYGIGSSMYGPRNTVFIDFINQILDKANFSLYKFDSVPLPTLATRQEILSMPFIGRTTIEIDSNSSISAQITGLFGGDINEIDSFEVTIKPKNRKKINNTFRAICQRFSDEELKKYVVRAKEDLEDTLKDFYITGNGYASDIINQKRESEICFDMQSKARSNESLRQKIEEFANDDRIQGDNIQTFGRLYESSYWSDIVFNYQ